MSPTFALGYKFCVNLLSSFKENSNGDCPAGNGNQLIIFWEKELKFCWDVCNRDRYVWVFNGRGGGGIAAEILSPPLYVIYVVSTDCLEHWFVILTLT